MLTFSTHKLRNSIFLLAAFASVAAPGFALEKSAIILLLTISVLIRFQLHRGLILCGISILLNLLYCCEVSFFRGTEITDVANQFARTLIFFLVIICGVELARRSSLAQRSLDHLCLAIAVISACLKASILFLILTGKISLDAVQSALGFETVTDQIGFGLQRLQFPADISVLFLIVTYVGGRRRWVDLLFLLAVSVTIFLSFSRYLFAAYLLCLFLRYLRLRRVDVITGSSLVLVAVTIAVFSVSLASRFASKGTAASDDTRLEQMRYLDKAISSRPMLGSGMGAHVSGFLRSETIPFSYELEWYAMTMQFGVAGLVWFLGNLAALLYWPASRGAHPEIFTLVVLIWMLSGFTNPMIVSLGSAFGLAILTLSFSTENRRTVRRAALPT